MAQKNDRVEKKRLLIDNEEWDGLVHVGEIKLEEPMVDVPSFKKIVPVKSGVKKMPSFEITFKFSNGSDTQKKVEDWFYKNETKDVTIIRTDAHGTEFARVLAMSCEAASLNIPPYEAASPTFAQGTITLTPFEIQRVEA